MCCQCGRLLPVDKTTKLEMGYTAAEFKKALLGQFAHNSSYQVNIISDLSFKLVYENGDFDIDIEIEKAPPRIIAMLSLPVLQTTFHFSNEDKQQQSEFFRVFFKYFHKGGG